jgi:hypothetical protein
VIQRRTMYPNGVAVTIDLEFRPISIQMTDNVEARTMALVMGTPLTLQVQLDSPSTYTPNSMHPAVPSGATKLYHTSFLMDCGIENPSVLRLSSSIESSQDDGQKEMLRSHEMLRHSPTLSMLFDIGGEMIQVRRAACDLVFDY